MGSAVLGVGVPRSTGFVSGFGELVGTWLAKGPGVPMFTSVA